MSVTNRQSIFVEQEDRPDAAVYNARRRLRGCQGTRRRRAGGACGCAPRGCICMRTRGPPDALTVRIETPASTARPRGGGSRRGGSGGLVAGRSTAGRQGQGCSLACRRLAAAAPIPPVLCACLGVAPQPARYSDVSAAGVCLAARRRRAGARVSMRGTARGRLPALLRGRAAPGRGGAPPRPQRVLLRL